MASRFNSPSLYEAQVQRHVFGSLTVPRIKYLFSCRLPTRSRKKLLESWSETKTGWEDGGKPDQQRLHFTGDGSDQNSVEMMFRAKLSETEKLPHQLQLYLYRPISLFLPRS